MPEIQQRLQEETEANPLSEVCLKSSGNPNRRPTGIPAHSGFAEKWLATVCEQLPGIHSAVLVAPDQSSQPAPLLARWPSNLDKTADFFVAVKYALKKRGEVCLARTQVISGQQMDLFAKPIYLRSRLAGVLVIKMNHLPTSKHLAVFNSLKRSVKWLGLASCMEPDPADDDLYRGIANVLASCFEQRSYQQGLAQMVIELGSQFNCERVAVAEMRGQHCAVVALTNSDESDRQSGLLHKIADAMNESVSQNVMIRFPERRSNLVQQTHQELAQNFEFDSIATLPLIFEGRFFGAITLMSNKGSLLDDRAIEQCSKILTLLTPFVALMRDRERGNFARIGDRFRTVTELLLRLGRGESGEVANTERQESGSDLAGEADNYVSRRIKYGARIYRDKIDKRLTLINRINAMSRSGRPVLIGTCDAESSEQVGAWLEAEGFEYRMLGAGQDSQEADIIATAGQRGAITVATNMAGCGTDIALGPGVDELGGLHVIALSLEAYRLDQKLDGRCARQSDADSCEAILSLEDESLVHYFSSVTMTFLRVLCAEGKPLSFKLSRLLLH